MIDIKGIKGIQIIKKADLELMKDSNVFHVWIDSTAAKTLLSFNNRNRTLRNGVVEDYAMKMLNGEWRLSMDPIIIDSNDTIANGQHRLNAVAMSETEQQFLVAIGVAPEMREVIDCGLRRTTSDLLEEPQREVEICKFLSQIYSSDSKVTTQQVRAAHNLFSDPVRRMLSEFSQKKKFLTSVPIKAAFTLMIASGAKAKNYGKHALPDNRFEKQYERFASDSEIGLHPALRHFQQLVLNESKSVRVRGTGVGFSNRSELFARAWRFLEVVRDDEDVRKILMKNPSVTLARAKEQLVDLAKKEKIDLSAKSYGVQLKRRHAK